MYRNLRQWLFLIGTLLLLCACAPKVYAPVEERVVISSRQEVVRFDDSFVRVVQSGDTLYSIAFDHSLDVNQVAQWNRIVDTSKLQVGQRILLKAPIGFELEKKVAITQNLDQVAQPGRFELSKAGERVEGRTVNLTEGVAKPNFKRTESRVVAIPSSMNNLKEQLPERFEETKAGEVIEYEVVNSSEGIVKPNFKRTESRVVTIPNYVIEKSPTILAERPGLAVIMPSKISGKTVVEPVPSLLERWQWPVNGDVIERFSILSGQQGVIIGGALRSPVLAAKSGEVVYVGNAINGYGNLIIVKHDERFLSAYAHNLKILVTEGQQVKLQQEIGLVGTDNKSREAVHFQIRKDGGPVNPLSYLPAR